MTKSRSTGEKEQFRNSESQISSGISWFWVIREQEYQCRDISGGLSPRVTSNNKTSLHSLQKIFFCVCV